MPIPDPRCIPAGSRPGGPDQHRSHPLSANIFLLNAGRYIIADPDVALAPTTLKKLRETGFRSGSHRLRTPNGLILALTIGKKGEFETDLGTPIQTESGQIAFLPCAAADKLLPAVTLRIQLDKPALLYFAEGSFLAIDGKLKIFI